MRTMGFEKESLDSCVIAAQQERVVVMREGKPVALIIGLDEDRKSLGSDNAFWKLIEERRSQNVVSREELESILHAD